MKYKVAACQMKSYNNKEENINRMKDLVRYAAEGGAKLVSLPEYWDYLALDPDVVNFAESIPGPTTEIMQNLARKFGIFLHGGSIVEKSEDKSKIYNTTLMINPSGEIICKYRKVHLSKIILSDNATIVRESDNVKNGDSVEIVKTKIGVLGFSICFDMRFPEIYRTLFLKGAEIIFVPSAFTMFTGKDHWDVLLRARAIENQAYIVAAAQFGARSKDEVYYGRTIIINPWGIILSKAPDETGVIFAEIDLDYIRSVRQNIPCIECRRPNVYSKYQM